MADNKQIENVDDLFADDLAKHRDESVDAFGNKTIPAGNDDYIVMDSDSLSDIIDTEAMDELFGDGDDDMLSGILVDLDEDETGGKKSKQTERSKKWKEQSKAKTPKMNGLGSADEVVVKEEEMDFAGLDGEVPDAVAKRSKKKKPKKEESPEHDRKRMSANGLGSADAIFADEAGIGGAESGLGDEDEISDADEMGADGALGGGEDDVAGDAGDEMPSAYDELDDIPDFSDDDDEDGAGNDDDEGDGDETDESSSIVLGRQGDEYDEVELPDWADSIRRKVNANVAHAFLLNGNVRDYMVRNITIKDGIVMVLDNDFEGFDIIAEYDQAHGLYFYGKHVEVIEGDDSRMLADAYRERFMEEMEKACQRLSIPCPAEIPNKDAVLLFTIISDIFKQPSDTRHAKILLFIDYSDLLVPDASSAQMKPEERKLAITLADIGRSQEAEDAGNVMIFITDDMTQLSNRIRNADSRIEQIKIPIPDQEERLDFIEHFLDVPENALEDGTQIFEHPDSIDKHTFAINSAGLSRIQIEDIMLRALSENEPLSMQLMKERKQEIIREDYDDVLEIIDPKTGFEAVGGLEHMKRFFQEEVIDPVHTGEKEAVPMGVLLQGPPGTSKRCRYGTLIPTPDGFVKIENIQPGDSIFGLDGSPHRVIGKSEPVFQDIYEVVLKDGRSVQCSGDHLWTVYKKSHGKYRPFDMTTEDMLAKGVNETYEREEGTNRNNRKRFRLPICDAVQYPKRDYKIDPYAMGVFLGDGCKNKGGDFILSSNDSYVPNEIARLLNATCENTREYSWIMRDKDNNARLKVKAIAPEYEELLTSTYCGDKYIPEEYKIGSVEQRWSLLQGLMDTDGCIVAAKGRYNIRFATTSPQLADDIMEVAFSLGLTCTKKLTVRKNKYIKEGEPYVYQNDLIEISFNVPPKQKPNFFRLPRKKDIAIEGSTKSKRRCYDLIEIDDIRKTGERDYCVCLRVDTEDHLFLAGKYVPTHNTFLSKAVAKEAGMNFVALNLNRIMEKWVGSTERNLDRALDCALAMAPTIIFIDEIDEALPNRADPNASSVNKRINQRLLTFFSDTTHRGEVIILAATNYPEKIDPAFKRAGRFDIRVPMFAPDEFDRMRIMNVTAHTSGFEFSWFESPDKQIANPFKRLEDWIKDGNKPINEVNFVGEKTIYKYETRNELGNKVEHQIYLPKKLIAIIGQPAITLQQLYENVRILFEDLPERRPDSNGEIDSDEVFRNKLKDYLASRTDVLGSESKSQKTLLKYLWKWQTVYGPFTEQTFAMTGAELNVVMIKAINLFRKWKRKKGDQIVQAAIDRGKMKHENDIPWNFLLEACIATINATAGIKSMEDMALLNTSDIDFIPDALYAETDDGRKVSYIERHEELTARQSKSMLG